MATVLKIDASVAENCKKLRFYETTGIYNAVSNTTGWGAPNEATTVALTATLNVLTPAGNAYTFNGASVTPLYPNWPTTNDNAYYELDSSLIGYGTNQELPDGIYRFTYTVTTTANTYTQVIEKLFYCNAQCCVSNMFADIDYECDCSTDKINKAKKAWLMLESLGYASKSGQKTYFANLLEDINKLCTGNCNC